MSYITTFTGKHFDPMNPIDEKIDIIDIAHALSMICRGNGHLIYFYSVGQHSINCAKEAIALDYGDRIALGCLLHDASEAYLSDVTTPVKEKLDYYLEVEDQLQNMIWNHFIPGNPLTEEEKEKIFEIDHKMLLFEFHELMCEDLSEEMPLMYAKIDCSYGDMYTIEKEMITLVNLLQEGIKEEVW
ncbi:MAG: phosphohydrolase [Erysipelotrichaceae bacterium]|nr:phosphohydrolase [Erysipelotrichaceae bacterium]